MRRLSIKSKVTLWFAVILLLIAALMLSFMLIISDSVVAGDTQDKLSHAVRNNLAAVTLEDGKLRIDESIRYYSGGVYTLVYSEEGALIAGQVPLGYAAEDTFENGRTRSIGEGDDTFVIFDLWRPLGWDNGVWLRGVMPVSGSVAVVRNILVISLITLPFLVVLAVVGGYLVARRAFEPIDKIVAAANEIGSGQDLTQRIGLPPGKDELSHLADAFDRMFARLEASFEAEKQFTSDASHELRTPTAVIRAQCDYTRKHAETAADYREALEVIDRQSTILSRIIEQLLDITRLEQGTQRLMRETTDLSALVTAVCEEQRFRNSDSTLTTAIEPDIVAEIDAAQITRLLENLLDNAYKYGRPRGHIAVGLRRIDPTWAELTVRDDGQGIPSDAIDKIWQRFYQVDPSRQTGNGLGLFMVQQIASLHGGTVSVSSHPGTGSIFTVKIPCKKDENL